MRQTPASDDRKGTITQKKDEILVNLNLLKSTLCLDNLMKTPNSWLLPSTTVGDQYIIDQWLKMHNHYIHSNIHPNGR